MTCAGAALLPNFVPLQVEPRRPDGHGDAPHRHHHHHTSRSLPPFPAMQQSAARRRAQPFDVRTRSGAAVRTRLTGRSSPEVSCPVGCHQVAAGVNSRTALLIGVISLLRRA
eukprot:5037830-Pleurochrysis_carterae.AAC.4